MATKWEKLLFYLSPVLYVRALYLPGIIDQVGVMYGYKILVLGWLGTFSLMFAWWANIFLIFAYIFSALRLYSAGLVASVTAFLVGLQAYAFLSYPRSDGSFIIVRSVGPGFYLWEMSILCIVVFCAISLVRYPRHTFGNE